MPSVMSNLSDDLRNSALAYHRGPKPGKLEIQATKPLGTQHDLALAYSPGVAAACEAIAAEPPLAAELTARQNLVAVISNGSAVLGLGNIGRAIAQRGKGFDMKVIAVDINEVEQPPYVDELYRLDGLHYMLEQADFQAISIPITPESRGLIGAAQLELMKPTAYLGIMSRGKIVDEQALVGALKENMLAGVGADVMATEPMSDDDPLWDAPRTILSPHMSGQSEQTSTRVGEILAENIKRFLAGEEMYNIVVKERGY